VPAKADARAQEHGDNCAKAAALSSDSYIADGARSPLEAMPPDSFGPKNNDPSGEDRTAEHYPRRGKP